MYQRYSLPSRIPVQVVPIQCAIQYCDQRFDDIVIGSGVIIMRMSIKFMLLRLKALKCPAFGSLHSESIVFFLVCPTFPYPEEKEYSKKELPQ